MSTVKANNVQVGQSGTATNNFTLYQPSSPDGTVRLAVGNSGATSADVLTANSSGNVGIGTSSPSQKLEVSAAGAAAIRVSSSDGTSAALELVRVGAGGDYRFRNAGGVLFLDYGTDDSSFATLAAQFSSGGAIGVGTNAATSGSGITFPATQSASSDANTLDDYEEGTWSPAIAGGVTSPVLTINYASYIKIGRQVTVYCLFTLSGTTNSAQFKVSGLPFALSASGNYYPPGGATTYQQLSTTASYPWASASATTVDFYQTATTGPSSFTLASSPSGGYFGFFFTYLSA